MSLWSDDAEIFLDKGNAAYEPRGIWLITDTIIVRPPCVFI